MKEKWLYLLIIAMITTSCVDEEIEPLHRPPSFMEIPKGFEDMSFPEDNLFSIPRWDLGKKLFYDPIMSSDNTLSCGSCHKPELAFSDDVSMSLGVDKRLGTRNSPSLANIGYHPSFTREGGVPTLEMQILVPIQEHNEFDFNIVLLAERLALDSTYVNMSMAAYGRAPDPFTITRSLATFERSLISGYSRYDQYTHYDDQGAMSPSELRGMKLFFGEKTNCSSCHNGFNFTNYEFQNNGLYLEYEDVGRYRLTGNNDDYAKFKVPSLRNVGLTAPYMHDGSLYSLKEVVEHYNKGGNDNWNASPLVQPLSLSETEKSDLVAFLEALTDYSFINNPIFNKS